MNRSVRTKKLTLHKESLRRLTRELAPHELTRALGGGESDDSGGMHVTISTRPPNQGDE
jgi:hypothetical protein